jgi:hypothetical protein
MELFLSIEQPNGINKEGDMKHNSTLATTTGVLAGIALGALAMYMLDPVQGNRRRALAKDKLYSARVHTGKWANAKSRDLTNRAKGVCAKASHMFPKSRPSTESRRAGSAEQEVSI